MTLHDMVTEIHERTHVDKIEILSRAREAWPQTVDFKPVQARLLEKALLAELKKGKSGH